jgi:hypothetical protein
MSRLLQIAMLPIALALTIATHVLTLGRSEANDQVARARSCGQFEGRYSADPASVIYVQSFGNARSARPILWGAFQPLTVTSADRLVVTNRASRTLHFLRTADHCIVAVDARGFDHDVIYRKEGVGHFAGIELLLQGRANDALNRFRKARFSAEALAQLESSVVYERPSKLHQDLLFGVAAVAEFPHSSELRSMLALLEVGSGMRAAALRDFRQSLQEDPGNKLALTALRRLSLRPGTNPSVHDLSFDVDDLWKPPTTAEIRAATEAWAKRGMVVGNVRSLYRKSISLGWGKANVTVLSYRVNGTPNVGAVIEPATGPIDGVILDIKGVHLPTYRALNIEDTLSFALLGAKSSHYAYLVPALQGETLHLSDQSFTSGGNRYDAWDGATDSSIGLVKAATIRGHPVDVSKICAVGLSRGASVALLVGERIAVRCVVAFSGPTDWFHEMPLGYPIWTSPDVVRDSVNLPDPTSPSASGYWFFQWFLAPAFNRVQTLADVRRKMLQSSPRFFAGRLPNARVFYGLDDNEVPPGNGRALAAQMNGRKMSTVSFAATFYPDAGHDTNVILSYPAAAAFLTKELSSPSLADPR